MNEFNDFLEEAQDELYVRIYGRTVAAIEKINSTTTSDLGHSNSNLTLVRVYGLGYGINNQRCLPVDPFFMIVSGDGKNEGCENIDMPQLKVWVLNKSVVTMKLEPSTGKVEDLLQDLGPIDIKVKPKLSVQVRSRNDTQICIYYQISIKAYYRVFGSGWNRFLSISEDGNECIGIDSCINVISNDVITANLCYYPKDNKVCIKGKVGYKGVRVSITECFNL